MRNRDFGFVALGRFLAVEQYYETQLLAALNRLSGVKAAVVHPTRS